jgi:hypothetical protein
LRKLSSIIVILFFSLLLNAQVEMPLDTLFKQFEKVKAICERDNGKLWGMSLYAPILVIDKKTRMIVANEPDLEGQLQKKGNVYVGHYPTNNVVGASSGNFAGKSWATIPYPFDWKDSLDIYCTYIHESFHRIQHDLGFNCKGYNNSQMDRMDARIYLNLEWRALISAVNSTDNNRITAIKDALLFRQQRRKIYPGADTNESRFEIHEGLADYTAFKLCCNSDSDLKERLLQRQSRFLDNKGSYVRSYGYYSGFLYAYLLDVTGTSWRKGLSCDDDLGLLLLRSLKIDISQDTANWFNQSKERYPYQEIYNSELVINNDKEKELSDYRKRFTQNPVVKIDLIKVGFLLKCSPRPLDTLGDVYSQIDITDKWGYLTVTDKGCLLSTTYKKATITADSIKINGQLITGDGWTLKLNDNWTIIKQQDNYIIKEKDNTGK